MNIKVEAPQIIYMTLLLIGTGVAWAKVGQSKGHYGAMECFVGPALATALLWWGGFFG